MERRNRITLRDVKYNVGGTKGDISTIWPVRIKSEGFPTHSIGDTTNVHF